MRRAALSLLLALVAAAPAAAATEGAVPLERWQHAGAPTGPWADVQVPHLLDQRPIESRFGGRVGWYRATFDAPGPGAWGVRFGAVRRTAQVTLNGRLVGTHRDPYVPFTLPLSGLRERGNVLLVRADGRKDDTVREGWWNWGGIARPVQLVPLGPVVADRPAFLSDLRCTGPGRCAGGFRFDAVLRNRSDRVQRATVTARVAGRARTLRTRPLGPGETTRVTARLPVPGPRLWEPGSPERYEATVEVRVDGRVVQREVQRPGLRSVEVVGGRLVVNGRAAQLRGASIQEDLPGRGAALRDEDVRTIVRELQAVGANVTRAHYLLDERLLDALDAAGIFVWSQAPVYHADVQLETAAGREAALQTVRDTVLEARSHPSVLTHSVANELAAEADGVPGTRAFLEQAAAETRRLDPTLPVSLDLLSYPSLPRQEVFARFDLLGVNSYFGWYKGKEGPRSTARLEDLGPFLDRQRELYPRQAHVLTEFGAESTYDGPAHVKETFAFQERYVRRTIEIAAARPWLGGIIHWTLREFAVKPNWDGGALRKGIEKDGIHNKGLITYAGKPKPAWDVAREDFTSTPPLREDTALPGTAPASTALSAQGVGVLAGLLALVVGLLWLAVKAARVLLRPPPTAQEEPAEGAPRLRVIEGGREAA